MDNQDNQEKNYVLAGKFSLYGLIALVVSIPLCSLAQGLGGLLAIISFLSCLVGFILGLCTKNVRAIVMGAVGWVSFALIMAIGLWAISNALV